MRRRGLRSLLTACACVLAVPVAAQDAQGGAIDTLREALAMANRTNPFLLAARANQRATDENVPIERAGALPSLNATGTANQSVYESQATGNPVRNGIAQLSLGVPLYAGGGVRNSIRAAETRVLAGRADLRGTESQIFSQVVAAYMEVIYQEAIVGLAASNVDVLQINLQATSDRFEIGDLTRTDVAQSEARLALARGELRTAQANLVRARENYIVVVGGAPGTLEAPPPLPGLPEDPDTAVDVALEDNPDLIGAHERARAAGYDIRVAGANRLPRVDVTAGADYQTFFGSLPGASTGLVANSSHGATAGVRATLPIFQGGRAGALIRQSQARASSALENVIATERDVIATTRASYSSWRAANEIIGSTQAAVEAAELSLEGVRAEQTVGNRTILDFLDAQQELLRAQVQLVTARRNAYIAGFTLLAAMGHAEARDLGLEEFGPLYDPVANYERVRGNIWDWSSDPDPTTQSTRTVDIPAQDANIPDLQTVE
ncbi:MAG TPA: TolC family outer membrane protein [Croceibacterium sp.]